MTLQSLYVGHGRSVAANRVVGISPVDDSIKSKLDIAGETGKLLDFSNGRPVRTAIFMDTGEVVLSSVAAETIHGKILDLNGRK